MSDDNVWFSRNVADLQSKIPPYYMLLEANTDNNILLSACSLGGSIWNGSLWMFQKPEDAVALRKGIAMEVDAGASAMKFLPAGNQIIIADYECHLYLVDIQKAAKDCIPFFVRGAEFSAHDDFVTCVDVDETGTIMVSGSMDDSVITWDVETSGIQMRYPYVNIVRDVKFLPKQNAIFVTAGQDGGAFLWDTRLEKPASELAKDTTAYTSVEFVGDYRGFLSNTGGSLTDFDIRSNQKTKYRLCSDHGIRKLRVNRSLNLLAAAVDDLSVRVFDCSERNLKPLYESRSSGDFTSGLTWLKNSRTLLSCGWDSKIVSHTVPTEAEFPTLVPEELLRVADY